MSPLPLTPRVSVWEWTQTAVLAVNLAWTTLCLGGYRPETMLVTGTLTCVLLAVHFLSRAFEAAPRAHAAGWWLLPFLVYAAANAAWITPVPWLGWRDWMGWAQMVAVFWVVLNGVRSPAPRRVLFTALIAVAAVATLMACYQHFVRPTWLMLGRVQAEQFVTRASGSFGIPNSLAALLLLLIPALGSLALRRSRKMGARWLWGGLGALLTLGLVFTISRGAWLGLALALVVWPLASGRWSWGRRVGVAGGVLVGLAVLVTGLFLASHSVRERLNGLVRDAGETSRPILWRGAWQLWREHPVVGSGAGSFNVLFEKYRPENFLNEPQWAHNDYLNTLSDYGAIGFVLFFGAVAAIAWRCRRGPAALSERERDWLDAPATIAALAVGVLAFVLQLFVDFHFKIPALAMAFATTCALIVQRTWPVPARAAPPRNRLPGAVGILAAVAIAAFAALVVVPHFRAEALRYRAHQSIDRLADAPPDPVMYRETLIVARAEMARAVIIDPTNAQAWADVAYADSLWAHVEPAQMAALGVSAEQAADRALALAEVAGDFWIRRGVARDMQRRWIEAGEDFSHALKLTPQAPLAWYYYAYHLSLNPRQRALAEAAVLFCLRLDPGNGPGIALRNNLAISPPSP